ncbi:MAG: DUF1345 domain-containing protein [Actinomycetales bacterium]
MGSDADRDQDTSPDDRDPSHAPRFATSRMQLAIAAGCGVVAAVLSVWWAPKEFVPLLAWDAFTLAYLLLVWHSVSGADAKKTSELSLAQKPGRGTSDSLLLAAAVISLATVVIVLTVGKQGDALSKGLHGAAAVLSVVLSWVLVHVVHVLTYARLYYSREDGGISFNQKEPPGYADFAYFAFTVGMTYQVSDTNISDSQIRRAVLRHALLSYLFGSVIVATTINLVVGLGK